jgi:hypothetical protein
MMQFKSPYSEEPVTLYLSKRTYPQSGNVRLDLIDAADHCPYMTCTVYLKGLAKDEVAIKNYSENEGVLSLLVKEGVVLAPHRYELSGYVKIPVCKLK